MDGFLWLLLQTLPLLTLVAILFFILGWRSRGAPRTHPSATASRPVEDTLDALLQETRAERDQALEKEARWRDQLAATQSELAECSMRESQLQKEILRLSDEVRAFKLSTTSESPVSISAATPASADPVASASLSNVDGSSAAGAAPRPSGSKSRKGGKKSKRG